MSDTGSVDPEALPEAPGNRRGVALAVVALPLALGLATLAVPDGWPGPNPIRMEGWMPRWPPSRCCHPGRTASSGSRRPPPSPSGPPRSPQAPT